MYHNVSPSIDLSATCKNPCNESGSCATHLVSMFSLQSSLLNSFFLTVCRTYPGIIEHKCSDIQSYFNRNNLKENKVAQNGFCFLNAVRKCILHDFYKFYTLQKLQEIVTEHLIENFNNYME